MDQAHRPLEPLDELTPEAEELFARRRCCCCFWIPTYSSPSSSSSTWERVRAEERSGEDKWWKKGFRVLLRVREWSELAAGPRWKTFIRRFNRNNRGGGRGGKYQYDALSYALNFDEGQNDDPEGEFGYRGFSARFATPSVSAKSSVDLGGRDVPPLFSAGGSGS